MAGLLALNSFLVSVSKALCTPLTVFVQIQSDLIQMAVSFKYWDECLDPEDLEALWGNPEVSKQRIDAGKDRGQKVLLSRDPDGQPYLTQTEMTVVVGMLILGC